MSVSSFLSRLFASSRAPSIDRYHVSVITSPAELNRPERLPLELEYVFAIRPSRGEALRGVLEHGIGIGIRNIDRTPAVLLKAVEHISAESQHHTIFPWVERLLRTGELPIFSLEDVERSERKGIHLLEDAHALMAQRTEFSRVILVPLAGQAVSDADRQLMQDINEDLLPHAVDVMIHRISYDVTMTRTEVAQALIKALLVIGPITHVLEWFLSGIGKVFAATADDLLSESAELFALRGSGFTWRQLIGRSRLLIVVFVFAVWLSFQVEPLLRQGSYALAGALFGLSAIALSLTTAVQSLRLYHQSYVKLSREGKLRPEPRISLMGYAFRQDMMNPARFGLFVGAAASPLLAAIVFSICPSWTSNGWVLALLGSTESIAAGLMVIAAPGLHHQFFHWRARRLLMRRA